MSWFTTQRHSGLCRDFGRRWRRVATISSAIALICAQPLFAVPAAKPNEDFFSIAKSIELLGDVYKNVAQNYVDPVNVSEFMYSGIDGMLGQLDPYTAFLDEEQSGELDEITSGQYAGIGVTLGIFSGDLFIISVIDGQPAAKAGLKVGDQIIAIDGVKVSKKSIDEVRSTIKGSPGTNIRLSIKRDGQGPLTVISLTRGEVRISSVPFFGLFGSSGYVQMNSFSEHSREELSAAIRKIRQEAAKNRVVLNGIVLDLRGNPGGLLTSAVEVAGLFVEKNSRIVSTRGRAADSEQVYVTKTEPQEPTLPLVVMIDGDSASASEIVSGAIQELDRGVILGENSFGKGLVQSIINLPYDHILKMTTAKYYTPSGRLIQKPIARDESRRKVVLSNGDADSTKVFYTRNRRKVYGGGGIRPDVVAKADSLSEYQHKIENSGLLFRYASRFHRKHPEFRLQQLSSEPLYDDFNRFLEKEHFSFRSGAQKTLDSLKTLVQKEAGADKALAGQLDALDKALAASTRRNISRDSLHITAALQREIMRHYDERAALKRAIEDDPVAAKAFALLGDQKRYRSLLKP
ncbi:MAG TPA: S41 family peptidase [Chlorobaculum sp.]|uniref:Carboxyl-terminal protease n=1 Tax=Chlorobaculum tepidum (strain ATCC 49652 / DSM 12025 / NBRC 103806 / TLS) TaxID=194439 RepID=Q8KAA8_CHLTE|nr:S41 family peptidase [Chlorobaculum tepidum]AAM73473.1 carboxyl-terminal protease [Chlorobaculum tepidum TLS]HBU24228.1 S41 family peptidase [Chlorobaculum sp.]